MVIKYKTVVKYDEAGRLISGIATQEGYEESNKKLLASIFDLPKEERAELVLEKRILAFQEPGMDEYYAEEEVNKNDKERTKVIEYALNDLKDPATSLYKDIYRQYFPAEKTKESYVTFGMLLIDKILAYYGMMTTVASFHEGKELAKVTATIFERTGKEGRKGKVLNRFMFFPDKNMWKDPETEFRKSEKYIYPDFDVVTMHDMDKDYVLSEIVPPFYKSLSARKTTDSRAHNLFDYSMECRDVALEHNQFVQFLRRIF